jgi:hypothetical protein
MIVDEVLQTGPHGDFRDGKQRNLLKIKLGTPCSPKIEHGRVSLHQEYYTQPGKAERIPIPGDEVQVVITWPEEA